MILRRFFALSAVAAAFTGAVLAAPDEANAHFTDLNHQHGWSEIYSLQPGVHSKCVWGTNILQFEIPNFMTTPTPNGLQQYVYFQAYLEYYDNSRGWTRWYWDGANARWASLSYTNWQYTLATGTGLVNGFWRDYVTGRLTPNSISFGIVPGHWYRVSVYYYWGADGSRDQQATNECRL